MNVENLRRKLPHEPGRQQAHVAGKADKIDLIVEQRGYHFTIVLFARLAFRRNDERVEPALAGSFKTGSIAPVRDHNRNPGIGYPARRDAVGDRHKIRAPSGEQNAEILHLDNIIHHGGTEARRKSRARKFGSYKLRTNSQKAILAEHNLAIALSDATDAIKFFSSPLQQRLLFLEFCRRHDD